MGSSSPPFYGEKVYRSWSCLSWSLKVVVWVVLDRYIEARIDNRIEIT